MGKKVKTVDISESTASENWYMQTSNRVYEGM